MRVVLVCATTVLMFGLALRPLLEQDYRHPGLAVLAFAVLAGVTGCCSRWVLRRRPLPATRRRRSAPVAQWIEHGSPKAGVGGSIPLWGTM